MDELVGVGDGFSIGVGVSLPPTTGPWLAVGVTIIGVLVGPLIVGRGVTVGTTTTITLAGVLVGALAGASMIITCSVGRLAIAAGVGLAMLCAVWVARSAAWACAACGAIGGSRRSKRHGL